MNLSTVLSLEWNSFSSGGQPCGYIRSGMLVHVLGRLVAAVLMFAFYPEFALPMSVNTCYLSLRSVHFITERGRIRASLR